MCGSFIFVQTSFILFLCVTFVQEFSTILYFVQDSFTILCATALLSVLLFIQNLSTIVYFVQDSFTILCEAAVLRNLTPCHRGRSALI